MHDCRAERFIPIYLIVAGVFGIVKTLSSLVHRVRNSQNNADEENVSTNPVDGLVTCFLVIWFIAGKIGGDFSYILLISLSLSTFF